MKVPTRNEFVSISLNDDGKAAATLMRVRFTALLEEIEELCGTGQAMHTARIRLIEAHYWAATAISQQPANQALPPMTDLPKLGALAAVAVALVAAPSWAQAMEPAPSIQADNWVQALMGFVFTGLLFPLGRRLVEWVAVQAQGKAYENAVRAVLDLINSRTVWVAEKLKEAASDGKVTREEVEAIATELLAQLPTQTAQALKEHLGSGVVTFIAGELKDRVTARARAAAAANAAVLMVDTTAEAMAARRARALTPVNPETP